MLLDVIIVTFNNVSTIEACLSSLTLRKQKIAIHIILVDNRSTDSTLDCIEKAVAQHDQKITIVKNSENLGFTKATNQGLSGLIGSHVLFLNPDTRVPDNTLSGLIEILDRDDRTGVIAPQLKNADGSIQPSCRRFPKHRDFYFSMLGLNELFHKSRILNGWKMGDFKHTESRFVDQPQGAFLLTSKELVEKIGPWDEHYPMFFSDVDWCQRVIAAGLKIRFSPLFSVFHEKGESVFQFRPQMIMTSHKSFIRYYWKTYPGIFWWVPNFITSFGLVVVGVLRVFFSFLRSVKKRGL